MAERANCFRGYLMVLCVVCAGVHAATNGPLGIYSKNPRLFADKDDNPVWLTGIAVCCTDAVENGWPWISHDMIDKLAEHKGNWAHIRLGPFTGEIRNGERMAAYKKVGDKCDLNQWNDEMWSNLRALLDHARSNGVYIEVDIIDHWVFGAHADELSPWHARNNINDVDIFYCPMTSSAPSGVVVDYLKKVAKETGDFDNVIYQIGNEEFSCKAEYSLAWAEGIVGIVEEELEKAGRGSRLFSTNSQIAEIEQSDYIDYINYHGKPQVNAEKPIGMNEYGGTSPGDYKETLWEWFGKEQFFHYWVGDNGASAREETLDHIKDFMEKIAQPEYGGFNVRTATAAGFSTLNPCAQAPCRIKGDVRMMTTTGRTVGVRGPGVTAGRVMLLLDQNGRFHSKQVFLK